MRTKKFNFIIPALVIFLLIEIISWSGIYNNIEFKLYDLLMQLRGHTLPSGQVEIVAIDEATMQILNIQWPLPRHLYIQVIKNIKKAGARAIVLDIQFPETARLSLVGEENSGLVDQVNNILTQDDIAFGELAKAEDVIIASKIERTNLQTKVILPNQRIMLSQPQIGMVNISPNIDNVYRNYQLFDIVNGKQYNSLALASYKYFTNEIDKEYREENKNLILGNLKIPLHSDKFSLINYRGSAGSLSNENQISYSGGYYSFVDFIDNNSALNSEELDFFSDFDIDPALTESLSDLGIEVEDIELSNLERLVNEQTFKNKIVFIGSTLKEHHDIFVTPFGSLPGVEIHANFLDSMIMGDFLFRLNSYIYLLFSLVLILLFSYIFKRVSVISSLTIMVVVALFNSALVYFALKKFNLVIPILHFTLTLFTLYLYNLIYKYIEERRAKKKIRTTFEHFMAPELVKELISKPENLQYGGSKREISVLFSDIRSFTTYTESHSIEQTVAILREYLTEMTNVVIENNGIIDKFVGDEIMALFGTPLADENHAYNACKTALIMRERMTKLQEKWVRDGIDTFEIGIGVNSGEAVVGNLGSEQVFDYTAIGDSINLGARLEALNKEYDTQTKVIISEFTLAIVEDKVTVDYLDDVKVKGKNKAVKIYNLKEVD